MEEAKAEVEEAKAEVEEAKAEVEEAKAEVKRIKSEIENKVTGSRLKEKIEIARKMKLKNVSISEISDYTGLSINKIEEI